MITKPSMESRSFQVLFSGDFPYPAQEFGSSYLETAHDWLIIVVAEKGSRVNAVLAKNSQAKSSPSYSLRVIEGRIVDNLVKFIPASPNLADYLASPYFGFGGHNGSAGRVRQKVGPLSQSITSPPDRW